MANPEEQKDYYVMGSNVELGLYNAKVCPFGQRAWFTILQKGIDTQLGDKFKLAWVDLKNKPKQFSDAYALALGAAPGSDGKAPTIKHDGKYMAESSVVAAYLDQAYNGPKYGPPLMPPKARDAALVNLFIDSISDLIMKPFFGLLMTKDASARPKVVANLRSKLEALNAKLLAKTASGEVGDNGFLLKSGNVSLFEILAFPFFYRFGALEVLTGAPVTQWLDPKNEASKGLERVASWYAAVNGLKSVAKMRAIVSDEFLCDQYISWVGGVVFYNSSVCPFGQRAWFALTVKNVKYLWKNCTLGSDNKETYWVEAYAKAIGHEEGKDGKVPIIKYGDKFFTESSQIVRFLDSAYDGNKLFPDAKEDPVGFHAVECLVDWVGSHLMMPFYKILGGQDREAVEKMVEKLYNDLKILCARLNEVSDSGLLLKNNNISAFEVIAFPFFWRFHLHPMIEKDTKKSVPIDKWLEKDSKKYVELKRVQDWYYTLYNHETTQKMLNDKDHKITIQELADAYGKFYSKPLK